MQRIICLTCWFGILTSPLFLTSEGFVLGADEPQNFHPSKTVRVLGKKLGAEFTAGNDLLSRQTQSTTSLQVFGKSVQALSSLVTTPDTIDGTTYAEFYSFGKRVFSQNFYFENQGLMEAKLGLAPVEIRMPFILYPIGPLVLRIDGGSRFQADVEGQIQPSIVLHSSLSSIGVKLQGSANGAGFVEAYASLLALRGGVGGQVDLINAQANLHSSFFFDGRSPDLAVGAMAEFLRGKIIAFFDFFNLFEFGWSRAWEHDFYNWKGYCFSTGNISCPGN